MFLAPHEAHLHLRLLPPCRLAGSGPASSPCPPLMVCLQGQTAEPQLGVPYASEAFVLVLSQSPGDVTIWGGRPCPCLWKEDSSTAESSGRLPREISIVFWRQPVQVTGSEDGGAAGHLSAELCLWTSITCILGPPLAMKSGPQWLGPGSLHFIPLLTPGSAQCVFAESVNGSC